MERVEEGIRNEIVSTARAMIDGDMHPVSGIRRLYDLLADTPLWSSKEDEAMVHVLTACWGDVETFVLDEQRDRCDASYLQRVDEEMARYLEDHEDEIKNMCGLLIERLGA